MIAATCPRHGTRLESVGFGVLACPIFNCSYGTTVTALEDKADGEKRKPVKEKVLERDLQAVVVESLSLHGYETMQTGKARARVKCDHCGAYSYATGWQGNDESLPDLFIRGKEWPVGVYVAVELKGSETAVRPGQQALCDRGGSYICRTWEEVWQAIQATEDSITEARLAKVGTATVKRLREEHGL